MSRITSPLFPAWLPYRRIQGHWHPRSLQRLGLCTVLPGTFRSRRPERLGWQGTVSEIGGRAAGSLTAGAWLDIDDRRVDVHYRNLDDVEHEFAEAQQGRFHIQPLMFHLAGIPSYLIVAELGINRVLRGDIPRPAYPKLLREAAPSVWTERAHLTLGYARNAYAGRGRLTELAGALAISCAMAAHAVVACRGEWVTNEKRHLESAGLRSMDELLIGLQTRPSALEGTIDQATQRINHA